MKWTLGLFFCVFLFTNHAMANDKEINQICSGDPRLDQLQGHWADTRLVKALKNGASWTDAMHQVNSYSQAFTIDKRHILLVLNWHEGDSYEVKKCLIKRSQTSVECSEGCPQKDKGVGALVKHIFRSMGRQANMNYI